MYALYERNPQASHWHYKFQNEDHLFGCVNGKIPKLLSHSLSPEHNQPYKWHLNVPEALAQVGNEHRTLIINLKPNSRQPNVSLYELLDVWGYSAGDWTPVMMRLRGLFVDEDPKNVDPQDFVYDLSKADDPIFSVTYLKGSIANGQLTGLWIAPPSSSTNSVLLWPDVMKYFSTEAEHIMQQ